LDAIHQRRHVVGKRREQPNSDASPLMGEPKARATEEESVGVTDFLYTGQVALAAELDYRMDRSPLSGSR
jgi:hypothetical protein